MAMTGRSYGRDLGLSLRMLFTGALLGLLYVGFAVVLFSVLNVGLAPMLVIVVGIALFQYNTFRHARARRRQRQGRHGRAGARAVRDRRTPLRHGRAAFR
jgi:predicted lipid-binding transport protein (Tim44 family)